ncbi:MAG: glycosyltransferase [Cyanobacteria bacterium J055]|nr:MAG: glycosyltransferase [Cyanobacteria bacterium J055]
MIDRPFCSLIIVNYNGLKYLPDCLNSVRGLDYPQERIETIVVDNGSQDGSVDFLHQKYPNVRVFANSENNFSSALNFGIQQAKGEYIGFLNNDANLDSQWLAILVKKLESNPKIGGISGKILLEDGKINSVGHQMLPNYYWADIGIEERDRGQYDTEKEVEGLCWAAVLFRKSCLVDVGEVDRDFVMYFEDVDYAKRCRDKGWKLVYIPTAIAHHVYGGSSEGNSLTEYFCNRNRFLYLAKHEPLELFSAIDTSVFFIRQQLNRLYDSLLIASYKLLQCQPTEIANEVLSQLSAKLIEIYNPFVADRFLARLQVMSGDRKMSICIFDHALHFVGGGQKYVATLAVIIQDKFDITFVANKPVTIADLEAWYGLDLSRCNLKIIPLPFFEKRRMSCIDSSMVTEEMENPFLPVTEESRNYDIFINVNQLEKVKPLSPISIFFCHFPDSWRTKHFAVDYYTFVITNSQFTTQWLTKRWQLKSSLLLYPPVILDAPIASIVPKEKMILSVARLEAGGSKKQVELIQSFLELQNKYPEAVRDWKLVIVGGSTPGNPYLKTIEKWVKKNPGAIDLKVNISLEELKAEYAKASIFWHGCGLGEVNPQRFEHFGMATVEAMQSGCVPIVFNGGGQREIVEAEISGFLFDSIAQLVQQTYDLITQPDRLQQMQQNARNRGQYFGKERFEEKVQAFFQIVADEYAGVNLPNPAEIDRL